MRHLSRHKALLGWEGPRPGLSHGRLAASCTWCRACPEHPQGTVATRPCCPGQQPWGPGAHWTPSMDAKEQGQPWGRMAVAVPVSHAISPAGTGPIHMNEVQCLGTEKTLWSCPFKNITQEDCKHTEDAAVRCNIPYMGYETLVRTMGGCQHPRDHGAWQIRASGPPEQGAGGGPMGPTVGWSIISPPLNPIVPHAFPPGLWQGCPGGLGDFAGGSPKLPL